MRVLGRSVQPSAVFCLWVSSSVLPLTTALDSEMGGVLSFRPERLDPEADIAEKGREPLLKPCWQEQTTQNDDSHDDYSEAVEPFFARTAKAIEKDSFDLTSAKNLVLDLRQLGQRYEERGCTESCMEGIIVSRALKDVDQLTKNADKTEAYDLRQTLVLVYLYCVMAVFPCTVRLERDPSIRGTSPYGWSRKGKCCDVELNKMTRYCFRSGCEKLDALQNFLRNTQLLMDLAAWLEMDLNSVAFLIASNTLPFLRKLSEKTNSMQGMTGARERLETLCEMGLVTRVSFLVKKDFIKLADDDFEPLMKVTSRRLPPYLATRLEYVKAGLFLHRQEYSNAMVTASDALIGLTYVEQKREFEQLIDDASRSFEAAVRHIEMYGPSDQSKAVPTPAQETVQQENCGPSAKKKKAGKRTKKKGLTKSLPLTSEYNLRETALATPRTAATAAAASEIQVRKKNLPVQDSPKSRKTAPDAPVKRALTRAGNETSGAAFKAATSTTKNLCHDSDDQDDNFSNAEPEAAVMFEYDYDTADDEGVMSDVTSIVEDLAVEDGDLDEQDWFSKSEKAFDNGEPDEEDTDNVWLSEKQKKTFSQGSSEKVFYPEIPWYDKAEQLLKSNRDKYKRCQLKIEHAHRSTAKVLEPGCKHSEILIEGRSKAGQTYMDDEVVVEVTAKPGQNRKLQHGSDIEKRAHGRVVGLLNRVNYKDVDHPVLYCTLEDMSGHLMKPLCKTVPKINVLHDLVKKRFPALKKNKVELKKINDKGEVKHTGFLDVQPSKRGQYVFKVVILAWRPKFPYPLGVVLSAHIGGRDYSGGLAVLSMQQKVPKRYPRTAVENTKVLLQQTLSKTDRKDLTELRLFTIDPPGSNDLDDAVSIQKVSTHYVIGVHIADVAAHVAKDSGVDQEARKRAVTFYPLNRRPHAMLPEPLSHEKCSLLQDQERLALSVFFTFNEKGKQVQEPTIHKTVIRSCRQLTYEEAQKVIDGVDNVNVDPMVQSDIRQLHKLTSQLKEMRQKHSMLFVPFEDPRLPELERMNEHIEAHSLIEELMILANSTVAKYLTRRPRYRDVMLVRCHKAPTWEELAEWRDTEGSVTNLVMQLQGKIVTPNGTQISFNGNGIAVGAASQRSRVVMQKGVWNKLRQYLEGGELTEARRLIYMDALHPLQCLAACRWMDLMETAQYRCCLGLNRPELRHFGLDLDVYTHFTSPIRRYADLHVQRLLHAALSGAAPDSTPDDVTALCSVINSATTRQKAFGKGCMSLKVSESLQRQPLLFRAYVDKVDEEQLTVCVPSLLKVSDRKQDLPFSMLGVSSQPSVLVDTALQRSTVTVHWNKKIFDVQQTCHGNLTSLWRHLERSPHGPIVMEIRPDLLTNELRHDDWKKILQTVMSSRQEVTEEVPHPLKREKLEVEYMSSEKGDGKVAQRPLKFLRQYTQGHVVQIQMSAHPQKGMLQSRVELLHTARNASVCMLHAMDPVQVLTRPSTRETRDQNFSNYREYVQAWMPLQEMEAAACAADNRSGVVINNVKVTMKAQESSKGVRFRGSFSLKATFCYERCIEFGGKSTYGIPEEESRNDNPFPLDYLCIRYTIKCSDVIASRVQASGMAETVDKHYTWLAHAAIVNVVHKGRKSEDGGSVIVTFVLSPSSPQPPPQLMTKHGAELTLEILPKTEGERRVQEILHELRKPEYDLAHALAHGDTIPELGSGKTNTGIKLVYLFSKINRQLEAAGKGKKTVLYCGPSNKSVDLVARELKSKLGSMCPKIVRVYGSAVESKDYPIPKVDSRFTRNQCDPSLRDFALHRLIRQDGKPFAKELMEFKALFDKCHAAPDMYSVTNKQLKTYRTLVFNASAEELKHHEVVLTTCSVAGSQRLVQGTTADSDCSIFQVIIDECAMSPEPHSMVPIIATKAKQVVLIGDHKQLRPIIKCQPAAELGLDQSLFERLFNKFSDYTVFLGTQYRMHPEICAFPSEEFYGGELKTGNSLLWGGDLLPFWPRHPLDPNIPVPHLLINVRGEEKLLSVSTEQGNERSKSNSLEADKVIEILTFLKAQFNVDLQKIKLLTQYNAQRHLLEEKAKQAIQHNRTVFGDQNVDINVSTVVSSQGGEWDYVILTTVSSMPSYLIELNPTLGWCRQSLGFITDRNQVNVALTRARRGLFIVGNVELLQCDAVWKNLVERYQQLGCVYHDPGCFPPPPACGQNRYHLRSTKKIV
ncbi:3'-5' exoribonuclease HELZ2-like isoform X2 [Littorina saxatilis]|uniref:3'-5' exoribonuclease HELZ2-like isoform X2 n=1 Tax=Littorina saxatilis TaxID=31220 RepID=UPI0038B48359